jgi:dTMP kinase
MVRGRFISLDGIDGAGKSTQCGLLVEWLRGRGIDVTLCTDPGGTAVGEELRRLLLGHRHDLSVTCEAFLFMASRAQLVAEVIRPSLSDGRSVVCDRFLLANIAYQGYGGGLEPELLWGAGKLATGGLEPDLSIVLNLPAECARPRWTGTPDRLESRDPTFHERVRAGFLVEARRRPDRIKLVDASQKIDKVHADICQEVLRVLEANPGT